MSHLLSLYLDETVVQAVRLSLGTRVEVHDARTLPFQELAAYLAGCREKSCILSYNPSSFLQDIVYLPAAASQFYDTLVPAEVRKLHPELTSFTLFHRKVGEVTTEGAPYAKIACFSYPDDRLSEIISILNRRGVFISRLYAAPYSIFRLATAACAEHGNAEGARLYLASLPGEKLFLLSENKELEFIRKVPSEGGMLLPADVQNLNMTVDYCFQSLRVRPVAAVMIGPDAVPEETAFPLVVPFTAVCPRALEGLPHGTVRDYLAPLAAALHFEEAPQECDILPPRYGAFIRGKRLLGAGSALLLLAALLFGGLAYRDRAGVTELRSRIAELETGLGKAGEELAEFRRLDQEASRQEQAIAYLNRLNSSPHPESALASLALARASSRSIKGIGLTCDTGAINVHIEGELHGTGYRETQEAFERLVGEVGGSPGYAVSSSSVDVKQKSFSIEARYSGAGRSRGI